jgi:hypothetical protein
MLLRAKFALLAALLLGMAMPALAADAPVMGWHIALRSGFDLTCARMSALGSHGEKTRLFLHPSGDDFVDINSADIVATEQVELPPDPVQDVPSSGSVSTVAVNAGSPLDIAALTADAGKRVNLDADLIASIIHAESAGNPHAISRTGARGLMQLMPATASQVGVQDAFNPAQNVTGGTAYFNQLLTYYEAQCHGSEKCELRLALAAYNAGPGAVAKYHGIPPYRETQAYVRRVIGEFNRRKLLARSSGQASAQSEARLASKATPQNLMLASAAAK